MKYYVAADIHGFYTPFRKALEAAGYFEDEGEKKLIICGDLFDRGEEALELQSIVLELLRKEEIILIRGNHEDLFCDFVYKDKGMPCNHHVHNGTFQTGVSLTGYSVAMAITSPGEFTRELMQTPYYKEIIPAMVNYYETEHYIFVHGWIPCQTLGRTAYTKLADWRSCGEEQWAASRWYNGMEAAHQGVVEEGKTIVCGHWHCSYGHAEYEGKGSEFGPDADFTPYYAPGIIAMDACTVHSGKVNVIVLED